MPISVDDVATLETYLQGVMNRSDHHAETVGAIALALLGAVLWRKDGKPLEVRQYAGEPANIVWFEVDGTDTLSHTTTRPIASNYASGHRPEGDASIREQRRLLKFGMFSSHSEIYAHPT